MLGVALSRQKKLPQALAESETAIGLDPTNAYAFYARSLVLIVAKRPREALAAVRDAIQLRNDNPEYFLVLAALLFDKEQWNDALAMIDWCGA